MAWRTDAAMSRVLDQLIVYKEIHGEDGLIALLEQELAREHALKQRRQANDLQSQIDLYADALDFYGNEDNYRGKSNKLSPVEADRGAKARRALQTVVGQNGDGETEESGDE
jgi:hypothetical protein